MDSREFYSKFMEDYSIPPEGVERLAEFERSVRDEYAEFDDLKNRYEEQGRQFKDLKEKYIDRILTPAKALEETREDVEGGDDFEDVKEEIRREDIFEEVRL